METLNANIHSSLTNSVIKKLSQNRIVTIGDFLQEDAEKISNIIKIDLPCVFEIRHSIYEKYAAPLRSAISLFTVPTSEKKVLRTGIISLDDALNGGLPNGFITEVCGLAGSGKSQLCFQLAVHCVKHSNNCVLYIDTKGDFSALRIQKGLEASGLSHREMAMILIKIKVIHIFSMEQLLQLLEQIKSKKVIINNLSLIVLDSLPCLVFQHYGDDNKIGLKYLNIFVNHARSISKAYNLRFVCVNIETRWIDQVPDLDDDENAMDFREPTYLEKKIRCLGKYWQHIPILVLFLEKDLEYSEGFKMKIKIQNYNNPSKIIHTNLSISLTGVT